MKRNRVFILVLAFVMLTSIFSGCGKAAETTPVNTSSATSAVTSDTTAVDQKPVTLRFSWWGGDSRNKATLEVIDQFHKMYPWITIEAEYGSNDGYHDKLATQLTSGTQPDIMQVDPETMPQFVNDGDYFVDFLQSGFDFSNYDLEAINGSTITGHYSGKQLGIPTGVAGPCMLVNKKVADSAGADFSKPYTWEDLITWGKAAHALDSSTYLLAANTDYLNNMVVNYYMKQLTGKTLFDAKTGALQADVENMTKTFEYVKALFDNNIVAPISVMSQYEGDNLQSDPTWLAGKYAASIVYISNAQVMVAANESAEYYAGEFPVMEGAKNNGWIVGCPQIFAVSKKSKSVDASIMFLNYFFNSDTAISTLGTQRSVPATAHAREIVEKDGNLSPLLSQAVNILTPYAGLANDRIASSSEGKQIIKDAIANIAYGKATPGDAAQQVIQQCQELAK